MVILQTWVTPRHLLCHLIDISYIFFNNFKMLMKNNHIFQSDAPRRYRCHLRDASDTKMGLDIALLIAQNILQNLQLTLGLQDFQGMWCISKIKC